MQRSITDDESKPDADGTNDVGARPCGPAPVALVMVGVSVALVGSLLVALGECLLVAAYVSKRLTGETIPLDLLIALMGRAALTHALLWLPVMVVLAVGYWAVVRRRSSVAPIPALAAAFVAVAAVLVVPVDLEVAWKAGSLLLVSGAVAGVLLGAITYVALRIIGRTVGQARLERAVRILAVLSVLAMVATGVVFVRSPSFNPPAWRAPPSAARYPEVSKPNVLWIVLDTMRADRMSCHGYAKPTTPFLDEWSRKAVVCDRAIADGMWTVPAHASMLTGLSVREHGTGHRHLWLDDSFRTVADALAAEGYANVMFSNNPLVAPRTNLTKGFHTWRVVYRLRQLSRFSLGLLCEKWGLTPFLPWLDRDFGAALTNSFVADWLDAHADMPKFVFINYMEAHLPYRVPRRYRQMFLDDDQVDRSYDLRRQVHGDMVQRLDLDYNIHGADFLDNADRDVLRGQYEATIRYLDDRIREVIEMFGQRGLLDNTLVVIVGDHGEHLGAHGMWAHRFLTYQDVAHVTVQIREPGRQAGVRISTPVQLSDLYATVLGATLGESNDQRSLNTRDLLAVAKLGGESRVVICEYMGPAPVTTACFEGLADPAVLHRTTPQIAVIGERFKLIRSEDGRRELYDLLRDPGELHNLIDELPDEVARLDECIRSWLERTPAYTPQRPLDESATPELLEALRSLGYVGDDD